MLQQLTGEVRTRSYIDGSYIGQYPFALYMRISGEDTKERLDVIKSLMNFGGWIESSPPPILSGNNIAQNIKMTALPSKISVYENGSEDYQVIFSLQYKHKV
jgi:hypothetical protein